MSPRMTRHLADAAKNVSGWYIARIDAGNGSASALLAEGLIGYRRGEDGHEPCGYYLTAAGRAAASEA